MKGLNLIYKCNTYFSAAYTQLLFTFFESTHKDTVFCGRYALFVTVNNSYLWLCQNHMFLSFSDFIRVFLWQSFIFSNQAQLLRKYFYICSILKV